MQYKGKELKEANGKDYPLSNTPKNMLVWDDSDDDPYEREVLGFFKGFWVIANSVGRGVIQWLHAAEIPTEEETLLTNRELAKWLAQGNGEYTREEWNDVYATYTSYIKKEENKPVDDRRLIRKWDDEEWHKPTREYAFGEEDA